MQNDDNYFREMNSHFAYHFDRYLVFFCPHDLFWKTCQLKLVKVINISYLCLLLMYLVISALYIHTMLETFIYFNAFTQPIFFLLLRLIFHS